MHDILLSNRDTLLLTGPMVFMLLLAVLRLDGHLATPARSLARRPVHRPVHLFDSHGEIILTDPDGRPSVPVLPHETPKQPRKNGVSARKIEAIYYLDNKTGYL
jgi:hypothetical protein